MGQEEDKDQQGRGSTMSKNGLGSALINLLEQPMIEKCGKPVHKNTSFCRTYGP